MGGSKHIKRRHDCGERTFRRLNDHPPLPDFIARGLACLIVFGGIILRVGLANADQLLCVKRPRGAVTCFAITSRGLVEERGGTTNAPDSVSVVGTGSTGRFLYFLTKDGEIASYVIDRDGSVSANPNSPNVKFSSYVDLNGTDPRGRCLFVAPEDGSFDEAITFAIDPATGALHRVDKRFKAEFSGRLAFFRGVKPNTMYALNANSLAARVTVREDCSLVEAGSSGRTHAGALPIAMAMEPAGAFAFIANSGEDSVWSYLVDPATGDLKPNPISLVTHTDGGPEAIAAEPHGKFLYVAAAHRIDQFAIEPNGTLRALNDSPAIRLDAFPIGLYADQTGKFIFALIQKINSRELWTFAITGNGALRRIAGAVTDVGQAALAGFDANVQIAPPRRELASLLARRSGIHGSFTSVGPMTEERADARGARLRNGHALIVSYSDEQGLTAEEYNPWTGKFAPPFQIMKEPGELAASLSDGDLVILKYTGEVDLYDPLRRVMTRNGTAAYSVGCPGRKAIALKSNLIFFYGGEVNNSGGRMASMVRSCPDELYDVAGGKTLSGVQAPTYGAPAVAMKDGRVVLFGGCSLGLSEQNSAEAWIYDPATRLLQRTGNMAVRRCFPSATTLKDGRVFVVGGAYDAGDIAEIYDPKTAKFSIAGKPIIGDRCYPSVTLLDSGQVLIAGGRDFFSSAEIFDPASDSFRLTGNMDKPRHNYAVVRLDDGAVLFAGGEDGNGASLNSAEIYRPDRQSKW